ncbi:hypothetical protein BJV77DRAFT_1073263 [Russula vinacea]|nr:hypothetical protein BJV77DRAFT_1073263 [Russula vinacea]
MSGFRPILMIADFSPPCAICRSEPSALAASSGLPLGLSSLRACHQSRGPPLCALYRMLPWLWCINTSRRPTALAAPTASAAPDTAKSARCKRCQQMKKGCSLVMGASGPCTLCVKAGAECVPIAVQAVLPPAACPVCTLWSSRAKLPSLVPLPSCSSPDIPPLPRLSFGNFLLRIPAVPVHGSPDVPLHILHDWHAELVAAQMDYLLTNSALTVASAIKEAADAGAKAAKARADAAASNIKVAVARLNEADKCQKLAWSHYLELVSAICLETVGESGDTDSSKLRQSTLEGKGKGKACASSHALEGEDEIVGEELESGVEDDDAMVE